VQLASELPLLIPACAIENTPLALNEATADLRCPRAGAQPAWPNLIFNPVAGQGDPIRTPPRSEYAPGACRFS